MEGLTNESIPSSFDQQEESHSAATLRRKISSLKKLRKVKFDPISLRTFVKLAKIIRSWTITLLIIVLASAVIKLIVMQINDKSYHIREFHVPIEFENNGYDGVTVAYQLMDKVNEMIAIGNANRTLKEVDEYNGSADRTDLKVELAGGAALTLDNLTSYLSQVLGIDEHVITGEILDEGDNLKLNLRIGGMKPETIIYPINEQGSFINLTNLIEESAAAILRKSNPLLLGMYYIYQLDSNDTVRYEKAIDAFKYAIHHTPKHAASAYAGWAFVNTVFLNDSNESMPKIQKALSLDPYSSFAFREWARIAFRQGEYNKSLLLYRKAIALDSTSVEAWYRMADTWAGVSPHEDDNIELCYRKCIALDSTYAPSLVGLAQILYYKESYHEASEKLEKAFYYKPDFAAATAIAVALYEALGDTSGAAKIFQKVKAREPIGLSIGLNDLAYDLELRNKFVASMRYAKLALKADSVSKYAAYTYSTVAELYGIARNDEAFYRTLEKSFIMGMIISDELQQTEPYKSYLQFERYRNLKAKYSNRTKTNNSIWVYDKLQ